MTNDGNAILKEVVEQFGVPEKPRTTPIPKSLIENWIRSDDVEVLGAIWTYMTNLSYPYRVQPPFSLADYVGLLKHYFERCIREDPRGEWAKSRYDAAWSLASWFGASWKDQQVDKGTLAEIKDWLAEIYKTGDQEIRRAIVDGTLEHLFDRPAIARFFSDWENDPDLRTAYNEATEWSNKGGDSHLV